MTNNEIYSGRKPQTEAEIQNHLNFLKSIYSEYLKTYSKASHNKKYEIRMNELLAKYVTYRDPYDGVILGRELLKYNTSMDNTNKIHLLVSRIVHNAIKSLELKANDLLCDEAFYLLSEIPSNYQPQYKDCYSRLACILKDMGEYGKALDLYQCLVNYEFSLPEPIKGVVPAAYLLTYCYLKTIKDNPSSSDLEAANEYMEGFLSDGNDDYLHVKEIAESLEESLNANNRASAISCPVASAHQN